MLIECKHCGAPLDVADDERATKCKYCGTVSRVRALRTVAAQTPPGWRPPTQWTPPSSFAADSAKTLAYHAKWAVRRAVRTVLSIAVVVLIAPVVAFFVLRQVNDAQGGTGVHGALIAAKSAMDTAKGQIEVARQMAATAGESLLEDTGIARVRQGYEDAFGGEGIRARRVVIHASHSSLVAQDPKRPSNLDSYRYRGGIVSAPEPERLSGLEKKNPEPYLFDFDDVPFGQLPDLARKTVTELGYDQGAVSHIIIERNLPFSPQVVMRVYVSGPRDSGRIDYLTSGKVHKVFR